MSTIALQPHADALLVRLRTLTFGTPPAALKVGDGVAPKQGDPNPPPLAPYVAPAAVLYGRDGGTLYSSLGCLDRDGTMPFQVTAVGRTASEARVVADKCSAALVATALPVTGRWCRVRRDTPSSRTERDDDVSPPLFYVTTLYRLLTLSAD